MKQTKLIFDYWKHWMAEMSHKEEPWLCYTKTWKLSPQKLVDYK